MTDNPSIASIVSLLYILTISIVAVACFAGPLSDESI